MKKEYIYLEWKSQDGTAAEENQTGKQEQKAEREREREVVSTGLVTSYVQPRNFGHLGCFQILKKAN